jgi:putative transposase
MFRYFSSLPEVIRLVVMMYVRYPLSLRNVEDMPFERGIDIGHETIRFWWNRFGPIFASDIRRQRISRIKGFRHWRCWGGRPPSASMCHTEVVADLRQGGRHGTD